MALTNHLVEVSGTQPRGQRRPAGQSFLSCCSKKIVGHSRTLAITQALDRSADEELVQSVLIGLFWVWTATSVGILVFRVATTGTVRPGGKKQAAATSPIDRADFESRLHAEGDAVLAPATPAVPTVLTETAPLRASSLGEALTGIQMPVGLAPAATDAMSNPRHMVFATSATTPARVGSAIADELERLDYSLRSIDDSSIEARRRDACIEVRIHPESSTMTTRLTEPGRVLPDDSVIVEFRLI